MADTCDRAELLIEQRTEDAVQAARRALAASAGGNGECEDCGAAIDPGRLLAIPGALRCAPCQCVHDRR